MKNTFIHRGFTLKEGKRYKWSGSDEYLYHISVWNKSKCKVIKIDGDKIYLKQSMFSNNNAGRNSPDEIVEFSKEKLDKLGVVFHRRFFK